MYKVFIIKKCWPVFCEVLHNDEYKYVSSRILKILIFIHMYGKVKRSENLGVGKRASPAPHLRRAWSMLGLLAN